jgi:hypothetical protein
MAPPVRLEPLTLPEAYATASLFMLALRETLWEAAADVPSQRGLWGPHGVCRAVCAQLDVPERAWEARARPRARAAWRACACGGARHAPSGGGREKACVGRARVLLLLPGLLACAAHARMASSVTGAAARTCGAARCRPAAGLLRARVCMRLNPLLLGAV